MVLSMRHTHSLNKALLVLESETAIKVSIAIMDNFVRMRRMLALHEELVEGLQKLENQINSLVE